MLMAAGRSVWPRPQLHGWCTAVSTGHKHCSQHAYGEGVSIAPSCPAADPVCGPKLCLASTALAPDSQPHCGSARSCTVGARCAAPMSVAWRAPWLGWRAGAGGPSWSTNPGRRGWGRRRWFVEQKSVREQPGGGGRVRRQGSPRPLAFVAGSGGWGPIAEGAARHCALRAEPG